MHLDLNLSEYKMTIEPKLFDSSPKLHEPN